VRVGKTNANLSSWSDVNIRPTPLSVVTWTPVNMLAVCPNSNRVSDDSDLGSVGLIILARFLFLSAMVPLRWKLAFLTAGSGML
jgi:hypothetical protein